MDVQLLKQSFEQIVPRKEAFARAFYQRLFSQFPETAPLFAKTDMARQQSSLMATLAVVVNGLANGENVVPAVQALGRRHADYGVLPEHFSAVGQALLETLGEFLGTAWTLEIRRCWGEAYATLSALMQDAMVTAAD